ncbi:MAG: C4-type zinc ribbon domain-containing protein [Pyrinomonadaceae bacterium MAG19_C2-C3]|nr:C4-type zinc ribbon domain-containing protein [Pyrinomonadaceae bacterium MAG19_C2-C3]
MKAELEQLINLQKTDLDIKRLESELNKIPERRASIEQEFEERAASFRLLETRHDEATSLRAAREAELALLREQVVRADRNLMKSQNETEYTAAIREADAARKHIATLETQIIEGMETIEKAEAELAEHAPEVERLRVELDANIKAFEKEVESQTKQLAHARKLHEQLTVTLPKQTATLYTRIASRIRNGQALAEARNNSCTACLMRLRPQTMSEVRRGDDLIICENCGRILYYVPVEEAPPPSSASAK